MYALSLYHRHCPNQGVSLTVVQQAARYLFRQAVQPIPGEHGTLAVWARPDIQNTTKPLQAKLDGAGAGLLALLSLHRLAIVPLKYAQALGRFIVYMQEGEESFYTRYVPLFGGKTELQSLQHYPMETVLGLIVLYEQDGDSLWLETACTILNQVARHSQPMTMADVSPGTLSAIGRLFALGAGSTMPISKSLLTTYALQICDLLLSNQVSAPRRSPYDGGLSKDGVVLPTAVWIEELLATLTFLPTGDRRVGKIRDAVDRGVTFLLQAQIREGEWAGAIPRAVRPLRSRRGAADFNQRATEVRIDQVQSTLRTWLKYVALVPMLDAA
ncbi:MAG: hypothetical protein AAFY17_01735 [Cyanobacteria bacterium J06642_11]